MRSANIEANLAKLREAADNPDWSALLQTSDKGQRRGNLFNVAIALRHSEELKGCLRWNESRMQTDVRKALPWDGRVDRVWTNVDDVRFTEWLQSNNIPAGLEIAQQAVDAVAAEDSYHPIRDWLTGLAWDGTERVGKWLSYYLGVEPSDYVEHVGRCWLISAVARVMQPGCKADHVLVLEGPQGKGKSTALRALAGHEWFTDEMADLGSKDAAMQTRGVWIVELSELDQLNRGEVSRIKAFITRTVDRFRPPYGRRVIEAPRECVFAGTVNNSEYLKDDTGNRRFWPVEIVSIDLDSLKRDRDQLWAEAFALWKSGQAWWLESPEVAAAAAEEQAKRQAHDPWHEKIEEHVRFSNTASIRDILGTVLEKRTGDWTRGDEMRVASCLRVLGFERRRVTVAKSGERTWKYARAGVDLDV